VKLGEMITLTEL